jgi:hypothetical protein
VLLVVCLSVASGALAAAQWLNYKTPGVPRTPDGKPKLDAPAPRDASVHPDLSQDIFEMFHENEKDCAHIGAKK